MDLLFIANDFPSPVSPQKGLFNLYLAKALAKRNQVRVVCPVPWTQEWAARRQRSIDLGQRQATIDGVCVSFPRYYYPPKLLRSCYGWFMWRSIRRTLHRLCNERRPDAVLAYWVHPDGASATRLAQQLNIPCAVIAGGSDVLLITADSGRQRRVAAVLQQTDAVLAVSEHLRRRIVELGTPPTRAFRWSQGVDTTVFCPGQQSEALSRLGLPHDIRMVVWVGRMVPVKGLEVLLAAAKQMADRPGDWQIHLVGDGPLRASLQSQVAAMGLSQRVMFAGSRAHAELADWYRAADVVVLPSHSEGLPNVLREAHACSTPFVASDVGGISEIADPAHDRLVPPGDPQALAGALQESFGRARNGSRPSWNLPTWSDAADSLVSILTPLVCARRGWL